MGTFALTIVVLAIVGGGLGMVLARYDLIPKMPGFFALASGVLGVAIGGGAALLAIIIARFGGAWGNPHAWGALGAAAAVLLAVYLTIRPGLGAPPLHDITTNVANPPAFVVLPLRADNLVPFASIEEWRSAHRAGYPDIAPLMLQAPPAQVLAKARSLAEARGWPVAAYDPAAGRMEATASAGFIRFYDDVVVVVSAADGGGSIVNMRSVSRVGVGDLGYNAARVKAFLADLAAE